MKENTHRTKFTEHLKRRFGERCYIQKNHGSAFSAGLPDLEVVVDGRVVYAELKAADSTRWNPNAVTKLQQVTLRNIHRAGGKALVVVFMPVVDRGIKDTVVLAFEIEQVMQMVFTRQVFDWGEEHRDPAFPVDCRWEYASHLYKPDADPAHAGWRFRRLLYGQ